MAICTGGAQQMSVCVCEAAAAGIHIRVFGVCMDGCLLWSLRPINSIPTRSTISQRAMLLYTLRGFVEIIKMKGTFNMK